MTLIIASIFIVAIISFFLPRKAHNYKGVILSVLPLTLFLYFFLAAGEVKNQGIYDEGVEWIPSMGLNVTWVLDGLSSLFALLITGIGTLVFLYANAYMKGYHGTDKFYFYLLMFMGAMLGLVLSGNLLIVFLFWELTSFTSYFLICFFHEKQESRSASLQALLITAFGGLALFAGIILLYIITGSFNFIEIIENSGDISRHPLYVPTLILILIGVFTKSAQFPFHFWLPGAMQAPTPVSAYLHSATMVKAGVYLLARLNPVLGNTPEWQIIVPLFGGMTMFVGAYLSISQRDLKAILAYTTISGLGTLVLLLGIDTMLSVKAALLFLIVHAFYKAALFMIAGYIDKKTGTRDIKNLGGLYKQMPVLFIFSSLALLSMAGLPPMLGFIGKELIYEAKVQTPGIANLIIVLGVASNIFMVWVSAMFAYDVFLGNKGINQPKDKKNSFLYLLGPVCLSLLSLLSGLFPSFVSEMIIEPALSSVITYGIDVKLKLWHGFNLVFMLSAFTVLTGLLLFTLRKWLVMLLEIINRKWFYMNFSEIFNIVIDRFIKFSNNKTKYIQHGYHRFYLMTIFIITAISVWVQIYITKGWQTDLQFSVFPVYIAILIFLLISSTIFTTISKSRLAAIIAMGVVGYGIALIYLYYSAIDLAITQLVVETLTVVIFVLVLQRLPAFATMSSVRDRIRDALIALSFGSFMTLLALKAIDVNFNHPISDYFVENSYIKAYGENIVNVILVDFRALDTLGEITVLTIAALGAFALIKLNKTKI